MLIRKIIKTFIPPIVVFVLHLVVVSLGLYLTAKWVDIPMHFLGGAAIAYTFTKLLQIAKNKNLLGKNHKAINFLFVISLVALVAVFWEFAEYLLAATTELRWQSTISDTLLDLLMGLLGGIAGCFIMEID